MPAPHEKVSILALAQVAAPQLCDCQRATLAAIVGEPLDARLAAAFQRVAKGTKPRAGGWRRVAIRAGRRSGKTLLAAVLAVWSALVFDPSVLAAGEVARVFMVGPTLGHTRQLHSMVKGVLDRIGLPYLEREGELELRSHRVLIMAVPGDNLAGRSGTAILVIVDEAALLPYEDSADGFDVEVVASLMPTLATTNGRMVLLSSPWAEAGVHHEWVTKNLGKRTDTLALDGPTWVWNQSVSEQKTHELESDPVRHAREYGARPGNNEQGFLDSRDVRSAVDRDLEERAPSKSLSYAAGLDVGFRRDRTALVICHREQRKRVGDVPLDSVVVDCVRLWTPTIGQRLDFDQVMTEVANVVRRYGSPKVHRDSFAGDAVEGALRMRGVKTVEASMASRVQAERWGFVAQKFRAKSIRLIDHPVMVRELVDLRVTMHSAGRVTIAAPNKAHAHDDIADALALAVMAARDLPPSGDIKRDITVLFNDEGITMKSEWWEERINPRTGLIDRLPALPPRNSGDWHRCEEERRRAGIWLPGETPTTNLECEDRQ